MVFQIPTYDLGSALGQGLGAGISGGLQELGQQRQQIAEAERLRQALGQLTPEQLQNPVALYSALADQPDIAQAIQKGEVEKGKIQAKQQQDLLERIRQQQETQVLQKYRRGEELTPEEESLLSPTSIRSILREEKPVFETEEEKLEAQRSSKLADEIEKDFQNIQNEELRLNRMEELNKKEKNQKLSSPLMVKTIEALGLPLSVLTNPETEEFQKLQQDYVRDVNDVFRGQIRVFEIEAYLKTIPNLMNSPEGREAIMRNRRLFNEAKKLKYDAYKDILKENKGRKPRNLGLQIDERVGDKISELTEKFREGINGSSEQFQVDYRMIDEQGRSYKIPASKIQDAVQQGLKFQ